jgi:rare lipoprotein A
VSVASAAVAAAKAQAPAPVPVVPVAATAQRGSAGLASWYGSPAGTCASPTLAFGTVVQVTDVSSGASVRCTVDDREAHNPGRIIDLSPATFSQLAGLSVGLIEVRLSW